MNYGHEQKLDSPFEQLLTSIGCPTGPNSILFEEGSKIVYRMHPIMDNLELRIKKSSVKNIDRETQISQDISNFLENNKYWLPHAVVSYQMSGRNGEYTVGPDMVTKIISVDQIPAGTNPKTDKLYKEEFLDALRSMNERRTISYTLRRKVDRVLSKDQASGDATIEYEKMELIPESLAVIRLPYSSNTINVSSARGNLRKRF